MPKRRNGSAPSKGDSYFFNKAKSLGTKEAYQEFISNFPNSSLRHKAYSAISGIDTERKLRLMQTNRTVEDQVLIDPRDGQQYKTIVLGTQIIMAENLNYDLKGSYKTGAETDNPKNFGRLYTWEAAQKACPPGWRLPSAIHWADIVAEIKYRFDTDYQINVENQVGKMLKSRWGWKGKRNGYDSFGFNALPIGHGSLVDRSLIGKKAEYDGVASIANYWTSTTTNFNNQIALQIQFEDRRSSYDIVQRNKESSLSACRCIKSNVDITDVLKKSRSTSEFKNHIAAGDDKFDAKDYEGAAFHYQKAIESSPDKLMGYYNMALSLYYQDKYDEAIQMYDEAIKRNSSIGSLFTSRGLAKHMNQDYDGALTDYQQAIKIQPNYLPYKQIGWIYQYVREDYKQAIGAYEKSLNYLGETKSDKQASNWNKILEDLARCNLALKKWDDLFDILDQLLIRNPESALYLNSYAYYLSAANRELDKAEQMVLKALEKEPENLSYHDTAGWIYYKKGNYKKAEDFMKEAVKAENPSAEVLEHMGAVIHKLGRHQEATQWWKKACEEGSETACEKIE